MQSLLRFRWLLAASTLLAVLLAFAPGPTPGSAPPSPRRPGRPVSYLKEVRPILAQHCFGCHGPDEKARKGKLRLDQKDQALAPRHGKRVIAPGNPDGSLAWERITSPDDTERMPPPGKGEPLSARQIATLKAWIEQGARWEEHWSFTPPVKPALPKVAGRGWVRDPL